jgi:hypothetical protein
MLLAGLSLAVKVLLAGLSGNVCFLWQVGHTGQDAGIRGAGRWSSQADVV